MLLQPLFPPTHTLYIHSHPQCNPAGRNEADSQKVLVIQDVNQIGEDPLIVFDGI